MVKLFFQIPVGNCRNPGLSPYIYETKMPLVEDRVEKVTKDCLATKQI